ncbi:MAG: hypothetical protein L7S46_06480, partial [Candidatus Poseidoniaceae archaeon]|nr:hypothetical protein [Candidatus Poseidoniaceae archaeon]
QSEHVLFMANVPEGWQLVCNGVLMDANGQNLTFGAGHITPQLQDVPCTLHRLSGQLDGKISFMIASHDGETTWEGAQVYQFEERPVDDASMSVEVVAGGIAVLLAFCLLMVLVLRSRSNEEVDFILEKEIPEEIQAGPPTSSGPPVSTSGEQATVAPVEPEAPTEPPHPPLPVGGLPTGWTMEQWVHYGQQYLDRNQGQP